METTLDRIKKYIDYKGLTISGFEKSMKFSNGSFASQLKNKKSIGVDKLENILKMYSDLSADWLLTGKGKMLTSDLKLEDLRTEIGRNTRTFREIQNNELISLLKSTVEKSIKQSFEKELDTIKESRDLIAKLLKFINSFDNIYCIDNENKINQILSLGKTPEDVLLSVNTDLSRSKDITQYLKILNSHLSDVIKKLKPFDAENELDSNGEDLINQHLLRQEYETVARLKDKVTVYKRYII